MKEKGEKFSVRNRLTSFRYAFSGLGSLIKNEHNSRLHLLFAFLAVALGIILKISGVEWMILILTIAIVLITEILNSAIERLSDFVSPDYSEVIKRVKDYCAAAVLIAALASVIVGLVIFLPKLIQILSS